MMLRNELISINSISQNFLFKAGDTLPRSISKKINHTCIRNIRKIIIKLILFESLTEWRMNP